MAGASRTNPAAATTTRRATSGDRGRLTLAVCHAGANVERHVAQLRRSGRFALACFPPPATLDKVLPAAFDAVLWELSPGHQPDPRRVAALARAVPVVSFSAPGAGRGLAGWSKRMGFLAHLTAPLVPAQLERRIPHRPRTDFASRLRRGQRALAGRLVRRGALIDVIRAVNSTLDPRKIGESLLAEAQDWLPAPAWAVAAIQDGDLSVVAERGATEGLAGAMLAAARWVIERGEELSTADLRADRRVTGETAASVMAFPLKCRARTVGAVMALDPEPSRQDPRLGPAALAALRTLLEPPSLALDSALRLQRAEELSVTDDLTGLYNSRYLNQVLRRETKRASRSGRPLSMLFIDLDSFKLVNDAHGHLCGSQTLVEAAAVIRGSARETDVVARFGGDEFAVVLPDTGSEGALAVGERVRDRIAAHGFLSDDGFDVRLTTSVGVATLPDVAASAEELIRAADGAMYEVKNSGKNGVVVATEETLEAVPAPVKRA